MGDSSTRDIDVRVIAATNVDLRAEAKAGRFREDLFFRLNVFPVRILPLRERREDIPADDAFPRDLQSPARAPPHRLHPARGRRDAVPTTGRETFANSRT